MKNINLKYFTIILFLALIGCEKDLNLYPLDQISTNEYWNTTNDLKLYVNQYYTSAFPVSGSDRYEFIFAADIESDDMVHVQEIPKLQGTRTVPGSGGWDYTTIRSVNYFLANYQKCKSSFDDYKIYLGEALFFRAHYYFNLVRIYGDVPWISKPLETNSEELYMARTPRSQVVDSIVADLDKAIKYLPQGKQLGGTRLSVDVALALKSRVCLYEGTWEKYHTGTVFGVKNPNPQKYLQMAVDAAEAVINSGRYSIYSTGNPNWDYFHFAEVNYSDNTEVMFWKKYDVTKDLGHARQFQTATGKSGGMGLTQKFVESYLCTDGNPIYQADGIKNPLYKGDGDLITTGTNRDPRYKQTVFTPGFPLQIVGTDTTFFVRPAVDQAAHTVCPTGYQINKTLNFDPVHHNTKDTQGVGFTGWILYRFAEVLLNYAEAKAELGNITQADIDKTIKLIRGRVAMPNLILAKIQTDPNWKFPNLSPALNEIRRERRVELIGEGFRWDDIARWAAADELITAQRPLGAKFNSIDYPDLSKSPFPLTNGYFDPLQARLPNGWGFNLGRDYLAPLSTEELKLNPALVQNPGW